MKQIHNHMVDQTDRLTAARQGNECQNVQHLDGEQQDVQRWDDERIRAVLKSTGAILKGHFRLTSGRHSDTYIQCARVLERPRLTNALAAEAAARLPKELEVDLVASPAVGGILFGFALATAMDKHLVFTERVDGQMRLRRSFTIAPDTRVLVAEDVVTTGGSVKEVIELVDQMGAKTVAVVSLIDRGAHPDFGVCYLPLLTVKAPSWEPDMCSLCQTGRKIDSPGSRSLAK